MTGVESTVSQLPPTSAKPRMPHFQQHQPLHACSITASLTGGPTGWPTGCGTAKPLLDPRREQAHRRARPMPLVPPDQQHQPVPLETWQRHRAIDPQLLEAAARDWGWHEGAIASLSPRQQGPQLSSTPSMSGLRAASLRTTSDVTGLPTEAHPEEQSTHRRAQMWRGDWLELLGAPSPGAASAAAVERPPDSSSSGRPSGVPRSPAGGLGLGATLIGRGQLPASAASSRGARRVIRSADRAAERRLAALASSSGQRSSPLAPRAPAGVTAREDGEAEAGVGQPAGRERASLQPASPSAAPAPAWEPYSPVRLRGQRWRSDDDTGAPEIERRLAVLLALAPRRTLPPPPPPTAPPTTLDADAQQRCAPPRCPEFTLVVHAVDVTGIPWRGGCCSRLSRRAEPTQNGLGQGAGEADHQGLRRGEGMGLVTR